MLINSTISRYKLRDGSNIDFRKKNDFLYTVSGIHCPSVWLVCLLALFQFAMYFHYWTFDCKECVCGGGLSGIEYLEYRVYGIDGGNYRYRIIRGLRVRIVCCWRKLSFKYTILLYSNEIRGIILSRSAK